MAGGGPPRRRRLTAPPPDKLPSWVAPHVARLDAREDPPRVDDAVELGVAWLQWVALALLSRALADGAEPSRALDIALRASLQHPMGLPHWRMLVDALLERPDAERIAGTSHGRIYSAGHPLAAGYDAVAPLPVETVRLSSFLAFLSMQAPEGCGPAVARAFLALIAEATWLTAHPPVRIEAVRHATQGQIVIYRRLTGTGYAPRVVANCQLAVEPGTLGFWDGNHDFLPILPWLTRWDERTRQVLIFAGRAGENTPWRFVGPAPHRTTVEVDALPGAPPSLGGSGAAAEPAFMPTVHGIPLSELMDRFAEPVPSTPDARGRSAIPVLKVVAGTDLLHFLELSPGARYTIGRDPAQADLTLHHGRVSRTHVRVDVDGDGNVSVTDLGSANGTRVNSRDVGVQGMRVYPGDVVLVGPVPLRVDVVDGVDLARLRRATRSPTGSDASVLTPRFLDDPGGLTRWLGADAGRVCTAAMFRAGSIGTDDFDALARLVVHELGEGEVCVALGTRELLALLRRDAARAERTAQAVGGAFLQSVVSDLPQASLVAGVAARMATEAAGPWLLRLRQSLPEADIAGLRISTLR